MAEVDVKRYWCSVCGRGIQGEVGAACPQCIQRGDDPPGILKTVEQHTKDHLAEAEAIKRLRDAKKSKGYKTIEDHAADIEAKIMKNLLAKYDLVPKGQAKLEEAVVAPVVEEALTPAVPAESEESTKVEHKTDAPEVFGGDDKEETKDEK